MADKIYIVYKIKYRPQSFPETFAFVSGVSRSLKLSQDLFISQIQQALGSQFMVVKNATGKKLSFKRLFKCVTGQTCKL